MSISARRISVLANAIHLEMPPQHIITQPCETVQQLSGQERAGTHILSVIVRRSYRYDESGICVLHEAPVSLQRELKTDEKSGELLHDTDLYPLKPRTDVVLHGRAGAQEPARHLTCGIRVGGYEKRIAVIGDRSCAISATGALMFSEPAQFKSIPLSYAFAYGGRDQATHARLGNPLADILKFLPEEYDLSNFSRCDYPRNPAGRGYLCSRDRAAVELVQLPNLEDPQDRLSPDRLIAEQWDQWTAMPLPQAAGWVHPEWFPRLSYVGFLPPHDAAFTAVAEVERGFAPADLMARKHYSEKISFLFTQGASLGLQFPYLRGDELIELANILPTPRARIQLPGERPVIHVDGRNGKLAPTTPVLHTVYIEPYKNRVSLTWRGSAPALRPYMEEELKTMPLRVQW